MDVGESDQGLSRTLLWALVVAIMAVSVALSAYRLDEPPWEPSHQGFNQCVDPHLAANYLRYGYARTRLAPVSSFGPVTDEEFQYRLTHGNVTPLLISFSYRIFGVDDWSARLVPLLFSVATSLLTMLLAWRLFRSPWGAVVALLVAALSPVLLFYGRLPVPHDLTVPICLLAFLLYWTWSDTGQRRHLIGLVGVLALGAWTDWLVYFAVPPLLVHHLVYRRIAIRWPAVGLLAATPLVLFGTYLLWALWVTGGESLQLLWGAFAHRTSFHLEDGPSFGPLDAWWAFSRDLGAWFPWPVVALAGLWLVWSAREALRRRLDPVHGLVLALFAMAALHNQVFPNRVMVHDVIRYYHWIPFVALAVAALVSIVVAAERRVVRQWGVILILFALASSVPLGRGSLRQLHARAPIYLDEVDLGRAVREQVSEQGVVVDAAGLGESLGGIRVFAVADRTFQPVDSREELAALAASARVEAVVVSPEAPLALRSWLAANHPRVPVGDYSLFDLREAGSDILPEGVRFEGDAPLRFGSIEYLGHEMDPEWRRADRGVRVMQRYLCRYPELLPAHRTELRVVHYWRKAFEDDVAYELVTAWRDVDGRPLIPASRSVGALLPTSEWLPGQVIRDERVYRLQTEQASGPRWLSVTVRDGERYLSAAGRGGDPSPFVTVGQVEVVEP